MVIKSRYVKSICFFFLVLLSSCHVTKVPQTVPASVKSVSCALGIHVSNKDYFPLYLEISSWIGVPYKYGGITRKGVDCSGLVLNVYREVYGVVLSRSSEQMMQQDCRELSRQQLRGGDLVFFATTKNKKKINHVGIYLKDNLFVHSTTSRGVILNSLDENYYRKTWVGAGRVKRKK